MTAAQNDSPRHVVPRWRSFEKTLLLGELAFPRAEEARDFTRGFDRIRDDWNENRTLVYAAEFAGAAIAAGSPQRATETVPILQEAGGIHALLGEAVQNGEHATAAFGLQDQYPWRDALRRDPRNVIAWLELARLQLTEGHSLAAQKSISVALHIAPTNRYVLRTAVACLVGLGDLERAISLLTPIASESHDPWLISAEIAVSALAERRSRLISKGRSQLQDGVWDDYALSELASEIATLEGATGSSRRARKLFRASLVDPTENAVAQATSVSLNHPELVPDTLLTAGTESVTEAFEAQALRAEMRSEFLEGSRHSVAWLDDQPFSSRAAVYASYIAASGTEDWELSAKLARRGLTVRPNNATLLNNLAFSLIQLGGSLDEARQKITRAEQLLGDRADGAAIAATKGLLEYRSGNQQAGRLEYERAVAISRQLANPTLEGMALAMHAREIADHSEALRMLNRARRISGKRDAVLKATLDRTETRIAKKTTH